MSFAPRSKGEGPSAAKPVRRLRFQLESSLIPPWQWGSRPTKRKKDRTPQTHWTVHVGASMEDGGSFYLVFHVTAPVGSQHDIP